MAAPTIDFTKLKSLDEIKSVSDVTALQRFLKDKGYDLGNYGINGDGVDGSLGKKGSKTRLAWEKYVKERDAQLNNIPKNPNITPDLKNIVETDATATVKSGLAAHTVTPEPKAPERKWYQRKVKVEPGKEGVKVQRGGAEDVKTHLQTSYGPEETYYEEVTEPSVATGSAKKTDPTESILFELFRERRKEKEKERTDELKLSAYQSLGNALRSLGQAGGWLAGGATAGAIAPDRRAYLESFNRAVAANNELSNLATQEQEYALNRAEYDRRRELALEDYEKRRGMDLETEKKKYELREDFNEKQVEGRIKVAEATARAKYQFKTGNTKVNESVQDYLLKRASTAYAAILKEYYTNLGNGVEGLKEPPTYDEFLKNFASSNGYQLEATGSGSGKSTATGKTGGFQTASGKTGGFIR